MSHHFILLLLNPFDLRVDRKGWRFEHSVSYLRGFLSAECAKNVSCPSLLPLRGWGSLTIEFTGEFAYIFLIISSCYCSISLTLGLVLRDGGFGNLCRNCRFSCHQIVSKYFRDPVYCLFEDEVALLRHLLVNLCTYSSSFHLAAAQYL